MTNAKRNTTSKAASAKSAATGSNDTVRAFLRDFTKTARTERSLGAAYLKHAHRVRDNFNIADPVVYKALRDGIVDALTPILGEGNAKKRAADVMSIARAAKLPGDDAPQNLQQYAKACRDLNPKQKRATGGKGKQGKQSGKMLDVAAVAKQIGGTVSGMKKRPATAEAADLLRKIEDILASIEK